MVGRKNLVLLGPKGVRVGEWKVVACSTVGGVLKAELESGRDLLIAGLGGGYCVVFEEEEME